MPRDLDRPLREAWIVSAVRTPVGRYGGALARVRPDDLAATAIKAAVERSGVDPSDIDDVILGAANQAGEDNRNVARMSALLAGLPVDVAGQTVNRLCGSGLQAINSAAHAIMVGDGDAFVAGGVESMTRAPYVMAKPEAAYDRGNREMYDTTLGCRFTNPRLAEMHHPYSMGETGENVAERCGVSREDQDAFALRSHKDASKTRSCRSWCLSRRASPSRSHATSILAQTRASRHSPNSARRFARTGRSRPAIRPGSTTAPAPRCWWRSSMPLSTV